MKPSKYSVPHSKALRVIFRIEVVELGLCPRYGSQDAAMGVLRHSGQVPTPSFQDISARQGSSLVTSTNQRKDTGQLLGVSPPSLEAPSKRPFSFSFGLSCAASTVSDFTFVFCWFLFPLEIRGLTRDGLTRAHRVEATPLPVPPCENENVLFEVLGPYTFCWTRQHQPSGQRRYPIRTKPPVLHNCDPFSSDDYGSFTRSGGSSFRC